MTLPLAEGRDTRVRIGRVRIEAASPIIARRLSDTLGPALERQLAANRLAGANAPTLADRAAIEIVRAIERAAERRP